MKECRMFLIQLNSARCEVRGCVQAVRLLSTSSVAHLPSCRRAATVWQAGRQAVYGSSFYALSENIHSHMRDRETLCEAFPFRIVFHAAEPQLKVELGRR